MNLVEEYRRQFARRDWGTAYALLPDLAGRTLYDLGCGAGDQAALFAERGARVIGFDLNESLLAAARALRRDGATFVHADLRDDLPADLPEADGIWGGFSAAYFTDLPRFLARWCARLRPGGFVALVEIDDLFGHAPIRPRSRELLDGLADAALESGLYDFRMGRKLAAHLAAAGLEVRTTIDLRDPEFAFDGPATPDVLVAWRARFERLQLLRRHCGEESDAVRDDVLAALARPDHRATARVVFALATKPAMARGRDA